MTPKDVWKKSSFDKEHLDEYEFVKAFWNFIDDRFRPFVTPKLVLQNYENLLPNQLFDHSGTGNFLGNPTGMVGFNPKVWTPGSHNWPQIQSIIFSLASMYINRATFNTKTKKHEVTTVKTNYLDYARWPNGFPVGEMEQKWRRDTNEIDLPFPCNCRRIFKRIITDLDDPTKNGKNDKLHPIKEDSKAIYFPWQFNFGQILNVEDSEAARLEACRGKTFTYQKDKKGIIKWMLTPDKEPDLLSQLGLIHDGDLHGPWILEDMIKMIKQLKTVLYSPDTVKYNRFAENLNLTTGAIEKLDDRFGKYGAEFKRPWAGGLQFDVIPGDEVQHLPSFDNVFGNIESFTEAVVPFRTFPQNFSLARRWQPGTIYWTKNDLTIHGAKVEIYFKFEGSKYQMPVPVDTEYHLFKTLSIDQTASYEFRKDIVFALNWLFLWMFKYLDRIYTNTTIENIGELGNFSIDDFFLGLIYHIALPGFEVVIDDYLPNMHWSISDAYALYDWNFVYT